MTHRIFEHPYFKFFLCVWTTCSFAFLLYYGNSTYRSKLDAPAELVSNLSTKNLRVRDMALLAEHWPQIHQDLNEVLALSHLLIAQSSIEPVALEIISAQPFAFEISNHRIRIGISFAIQSGQIAHAVLQAWILSRANPAQKSDLLSRILYADFFWTVAHSSFALGLPENRQKLTEPQDLNLHNILFEISSQKHFLLSDWLPQEQWKNKFANAAPEIDLMSLRPLILSLILKHYKNLSLTERIEMPRRVAEQLWAQNALSKSARLDELGLFINQSLLNFGFQEISDHQVFVHLYFESPELLDHGAPTQESYIVGQTLYPGEVQLSAKEISKIHALTSVKLVQNLSEAVKDPQTPIRSDKLLEIEAPQTVIHYDALKDLNFEKFARQNREIYFAAFDQESLQFAKKKLLQSELIQMLESQPKKVASNLVGELSWDSSAQIFRGRSAVEALQIWRPTFNESGRSRQ